MARLDHIHSLHGLRHKNNNSITTIPNAGWHLSYFLPPERIREKILNLTHVEFNKPEYYGLDNIIKSIRTGKDLFNRDRVQWVRATKRDIQPKYAHLLPIEYRYTPPPYLEPEIKTATPKVSQPKVSQSKAKLKIKHSKNMKLRTMIAYLQKRSQSS